MARESLGPTPLRRGLRRVVMVSAATLALVAACDTGKGGTPAPINTDKCFSVQVPGPVDGNGNVTPPGSTVPLDVCEVK